MNFLELENYYCTGVLLLDGHVAVRIIRYYSLFREAER